VRLYRSRVTPYVSECRRDGELNDDAEAVPKSARRCASSCWNADWPYVRRPRQKRGRDRPENDRYCTRPRWTEVPSPPEHRFGIRWQSSIAFRTRAYPDRWPSRWRYREGGVRWRRDAFNGVRNRTQPQQRFSQNKRGHPAKPKFHPKIISGASIAVAKRLLRTRKSLILWRSLRDSNSCYSLERAVS